MFSDDQQQVFTRVQQPLIVTSSVQSESDYH